MSLGMGTILLFLSATAPFKQARFCCFLDFISKTCIETFNIIDNKKKCLVRSSAMQFPLKIFLATVFLSLALFSFVIYDSMAGNNLQNVPSEAVKGKMVFQKRACIECHTVFGNGGYYGGDLTKAYEKFGSNGLREYLTQPPLLSGAKKKRHIYLSNEEAEEIIAYFRFLQSIPNMDWPPRPVYDKKEESGVK